jgi:hypothetical protein
MEISAQRGDTAATGLGMLDRIFDALDRFVLSVTPGYICPVCRRESSCDTCVETKELEAARRRCAEWLEAPAKGPRNPQPSREDAVVCDGDSGERVFDA